LVFALLLVFLVVAGTVPLPQSVRGPCVLEPVGIWYLARDGAGQIATGWERNLLDAGREPPTSELMGIDRPDFVEVKLAPHLRDGGSVAAGDTVAVITSIEEAGRLSVLEAELKSSHAQLDALIAGSRAEDIEVARQEVHQARVALEAFTPERDRIKSQYESGIATLSLWQETEGQYQLLEAELGLAEAELKALQTGARPEDIAVARFEAEQIQRSLDSVRRLLGKRKAVVAPTGGRVSIGGVNGYLLRIERTDTLAAIMVIPEATLPWLTEGQPMEIKLTADRSEPLTGELHKIDFLTGELTGTYAVALIDNRDGRLWAGMTGNARLMLGEQTLLSGLKAKLVPGRGFWR